jgi:glycosyltransferase involved in cell wall biosynthesis
VPHDRIVSIQTGGERGGAEYAHVDLLQSLVEHGESVLLLTDMPELARGTEVPVHRVDLGPKLGSRTAAAVAVQAPAILARIAAALRAERPVRLLLAHFKKEQLLCSLLPRSLTGEIAWFEWGPLPRQMRSGLGRAVYALAARRAVRIVAVSSTTAETIIRSGVSAEKVLTLPDLVNLHEVRYQAEGRNRLREQWRVQEQTFVLGCVSRLQRNKRIDVLIDAVAHAGGDVALVISGEGEELERLRQRAAPLGDRVRFVANARGHVDAFLSACDALAFAPSHSEADRPRVIVMAQLVGLPVLATHPEGAAGVLAANAGSVAEPHNDPRAFAELIDAYRDDRDRCRREGAAGREAVKRDYDPDETVAELRRALGLAALAE